MEFKKDQKVKVLTYSLEGVWNEAKYVGKQEESIVCKEVFFFSNQSSCFAVLKGDLKLRVQVLE